MARGRVNRAAAAGDTAANAGGLALPTGPGADAAALHERVSALRRSAERPEAGLLRPTLEAVLAELDLIVGKLGKLRPAITAGEADRRGGADAERRLLRAVFQEVPAPIFLLEQDGVVRRINRQAAALLGADPGSASGKPFTALIHLADRAGVKKQLATVVRTRRPRIARCNLLTTTEPVDTAVTFDLVERPGGAEPLIMAVAGPTTGLPPPPAAAPPSRRTRRSSREIAEVTQRFDLVTAASRLLLENAAFGESLTLRRCAALFASELSAWVLVDVEKAGKLRRLFVAAPAGEQFADLARAIEDRNPARGSLPWNVHRSGRARLLAETPKDDVLGSVSSGVPVLRLLGASTVLCVPFVSGERSYGTLTLARRSDVGPFTSADLQLVDEIAQHAAVAIKVGRMFLRRSAITEALQASLLPRDLPRVPGVEIAAAYLPSAEDIGVGGDFYDVYPSAGGWGMMIGDVCGRGEEAAAATALARYAIRVFAHWNADPADVLRTANEVMNAQAGAEKFVTAIAAALEWHDSMLHVALASTGHPAPVLVRPDGRVRMLSGGGLPLGFFKDARPAAETVDMEPGDVLFFYSDGVTEARNAEGSYFETELADHLAGVAGRPASDVVSVIRDRVLEFCERDLRDDMTIMAVRALDPPDEVPGESGRPTVVRGEHRQARGARHDG